MTWDGKERRKERQDELADIQITMTDIRLNLMEVKTKLDNLHSKVNQSNQRMEENIEKHEETLYGNGKPGLVTEIKAIETLSENFSSHVVMDKWAYGAMLTILVLILGKLIIGGAS